MSPPPPVVKDSWISVCTFTKHVRRLASEATWKMTLPIDIQTTMATLVEQPSATVPSGGGEASFGRWQLGFFVILGS